MRNVSFFSTQAGLILSMVGITLLWSSAGVINRQMSHAGGWDVAFWRSAFTAVFAAGYWFATRRAAGMAQDFKAGRLLWASAACWAVMFTCFMLAMSYTTVGHVLLAMSVGPFLTALGAWGALGQRIAPQTWCAVILAGAGLAYMFGADLAHSEGRALTGVLIAFCVPIAAAVNFLILQRSANQSVKINLMPAICLGAALSAVLCLPAVHWSGPLAPSAADVAWLLALGVFQLALPCIWVVWVSQRLPAAQVSLLQVLEIIFGTAWAWLWGGETPSQATLLGGAVVVAVLVVHGVWNLRQALARSNP